MIQDFRFYVTYSVDVHKEFFPLNFNSTSLIDEPESGQIFRRQKFNGSLIFGTNSWAENVSGISINRKTNFDYFFDIQIADPCGKIILEIERDGLTYWTGKFAVNDGKFDLDNCTFEVTPQVQDDYSIFDDNGDTQVNILDVGLALHTVSMTRIITTYEYKRNRLLTDVIEYLANNIVAGITVSSTFFNDATNPVTLTTNRYNHLTIAQKSDIKRRGTSDRAWKGFMSFNDCMAMLRMFNIYWTYDSVTNTLTVEHVSFFTYTDGIDLRTQDLHKRMNKFSYAKGDIPKYEKFSFLEGGNEDFIEHTIWYNSSCVNQDKDSNVTSETFNVTTDIEYIQDCMIIVDKHSNISDDGWVLLANYESGGDLFVYMNHVSHNLDVHFNADLSWGVLHTCFFKHDRPVMTGFMNNSGTTFYTVKKTKIQDCSIINCYANGSHVTAFDPSQLLTTELGETYFGGLKAFVKRAEILPSGLIKLNLAYGEADNAIVPVAYDNLIQIEEVANDVHPAIPTACTYYATTSIPADANLTITFTVRILTDWGIINNVTDSITIPAGTRTGNVTIAWPVPAGDPVEANQCRFEIVNVTVVGGALTWEYSFNLDQDATCE